MPVAHLPSARLYYRLEGHGGLPRLVLLHPIGADHSLFDAVVPLLLPHYQVLRPDLRGHGGSSVPEATAYSVDDLAGDVLALCDQLQWDRFAVAGVSLGGITAMQVALQAGTHVQALVVCSALARMHEPPGGGWNARIAATLANGMAGQGAGMAQRMFSPAFQATRSPAIGTFVSVLEHTDRAGFAGCMAVLRDADLRPQLPNIAAPTLVINGREDALIPAAEGQALAEALPQGRHLLLDVGHFPMIEAPAAFAEAVHAFLSETR